MHTFIRDFTKSVLLCLSESVGLFFKKKRQNFGLSSSISTYPSKGQWKLYITVANKNKSTQSRQRHGWQQNFSGIIFWTPRFTEDSYN